MLKFYDARNFGRTYTGIALIVGPLLLLIGQIVSPNVDNSNKVTELNSVAAHQGTYITGGILFFVAGLVLLGAGIGLIHYFRGVRVTLGQVAGALLALGSAATMGFYAFTTVEYEMVNVSGLDRVQMARLLDKGQNAISGLPVVILFIAGIVIGLILLAVAVWRGKAAPRWVSVLLVAGAVLQFVSQDKAPEIVSFVLLIAGLGSLGWTILQSSDEEWDAPRERAAVRPSAPATAVPQPDSI